MKFLKWWLIIVGLFRLSKIYQAFFDVPAFHRSFYSNTTLTDVHSRSVGDFTLLACSLCFLCAFNLDNKLLYLATFLSFFFPACHFFAEFLVYHTMTVENITLVGIVAGTTIVLMLLQWTSHQPVKTKNS